MTSTLTVLRLTPAERETAFRCALSHMGHLISEANRMRADPAYVSPTVDDLVGEIERTRRQIEATRPPSREPVAAHSGG